MTRHQTSRAASKTAIITEFEDADTAWQARLDTKSAVMAPMTAQNNLPLNMIVEP